MSSPTSPRQPPQHLRTGSDAYVEDVDPRFAIDPASEVGSSHHDQPGPLPSALTPGGGYSAYRMHSPNHLSPHPPSSTSNIPSYVSGGSSIASGGLGDTPSPAAAQTQAADRFGGGEGSSTEQVVNNTDGNTDQDHSTTTNELPLLAPAAATSAHGNHTGFHHHHHGGGFDGTGGHPLEDYDNSRDHSYENLPSGARSPAEASDTSHFTSISQRPINPNWRPSPPSVGGGTGPPSMYGPPHHQGMMGPAGGRSAYGGNGNPGPGSTASAVQRRKEDAILTANPDFTLPGLGPSARSGPRGGFRGGRGPAGARGGGGRPRGGGFMPPPGSGVGAGTPGVPPLGSEVGPPTSLLARGGDGPMSQGLSAGGVGLTPSGPYLS
ncbi:hypothetical protein KC331_g13421 [Hortaea werneckii]|nr:hypothetical protein KC331_g13421 [Hortaea werneckii]KAI7705492.1 hypothetical protein KC353_g12845 [Hortaea werneckii]